MNKGKYRLESIIIFFFSFLNILILVYRLSKGELQFQDFHARWQECAYFIRGINPFDVIKGSNYIADIGHIDPDMVTVPWAWIWGQIINPGFLPYNMAKIWGLIVYIGVIVITSYVCVDYTRKSNKDSGIIMLISVGLLFVCQYNIVWSFLCGNHGALSCCFIVLSIVAYEKNPYIAGILMTFALVKPQVALPFMLTFLLIKQFKVILSVAVLELISLFVIRITIGESIISLLSMTSGIGTNLQGVFFGLFDLLKYLGIDIRYILLFDFVVGVIIYIFVSIGIYRQDNMSVFSRFVGSAIASTFWFYKQPHDWVILVVPLLSLLQEMAFDRNNDNRKGSILMIILVGLPFAQGFLRKILMMTVRSMDDYLSKQIFMTIFVISVIIIGLIMSRVSTDKC